MERKSLYYEEKKKHFDFNAFLLLRFFSFFFEIFMNQNQPFHTHTMVILNLDVKVLHVWKMVLMIFNFYRFLKGSRHVFNNDSC